VEAAVAYFDKLDPKLRTFLQMYKWERIDPVPWAQMRVPLDEAKVGLVVAACMTTTDQPPFKADQPDNDASIRVIPSKMDPSDLVNTYPEQGFDHTGLRADANLLVPLDRLREMEEIGEIGEFAPRTVSLCGHLPKPRRLITYTAPEISTLFEMDDVDVVMLVRA
jgi:D-proline reductase (dithiol) PrdB